MAYTDFKTLFDVEDKCGVTNRLEKLFDNHLLLEPSDTLLKALEIAQNLPIRSEKAKSELIVTPILLELRERNDRYFTIYSGDTLNADETKGLKGECDFIIAKDTASFDVNCPILQVVEAKKNDLEVGIPQCAAQMVGAKIFNERRNKSVTTIYGCVTTGDEWMFLRLNDNMIYVDTKKYYLSDINKILGVFQYIIDFYKNSL